MKLDELKLNLDDVMGSPNISKLLDDEQLDELGLMVVEEFNMDRTSRSQWEVRNAEAMKLAMQVTEKKSFPWPDASNVKFPLLTIAAMQYHSRVYPALVHGSRPVDCKIMAQMPLAPKMPQQPQNQQDKQAMQQYQQAVQKIKQQAAAMKDAYKEAKRKAQRVAEHMSYQILEEDEQWEEEMDKLLLIQSIAGCAFKKVYYDPVAQVNRSECVSPRELVVSYYTKSLETCPRYTHIIPLPSNTVKERQLRKVWNEYKEGTDELTPSMSVSQELNAESDKGKGQQPQPQDKHQDIDFLEQYRWLDLDGDGYKEPYIITVRFDTRQVMRIVARFVNTGIHRVGGGKIIRIDPIGVFTKYPFIPSPDGGFYDIGFGALLGPINHTIDTSINLMIDAGKLATAGGGFLGRGWKGKKGEMRFKLGEWKTTDSSNEDLSKSVYPLPAKEPSKVLFELLTLLLQYGQRIAGATESTMGENPGQNTPANNMNIMVEQGMKVFNGLYKRTHRSFTQELRHLYRLNQIYIGHEARYWVPGKKGSFQVFGADYADHSTVIRASASPAYMSDTQRLQQAVAVRQAAYSANGYDLYIVERRYLEALQVDNVDELFPDPESALAVPPRPNPKLQIEQLKVQAKQLDGQVKLKMKVLDIQANAGKLQAEIIQLHAQAAKLMAEAKGVDAGHQIALLEAQIAAKKNHAEYLLDTAKFLHEQTVDHMELANDRLAIENGSAGVGGAQGNQTAS